jgi:hypothetical protein
MQDPALAAVPAQSVSVVKEHEEKIRQLEQNVRMQRASMDQDLQSKLEQRSKKKALLRGAGNAVIAGNRLAVKKSLSLCDGLSQALFAGYLRLVLRQKQARNIHSATCPSSTTLV